jgi:hypothetical protein
VVLRDRGSDVPFGFVDGILYRYLRKDLLDVLSPEALKHLELGSLIDRDGSEIAELRTVWSHKRILLRGGPDSTRWICSCKQLIYYPMGAWYIMRDDVGDTPIYLTSLGDLLLSAGLYSRVRTQRWKKVAISKIRILTEPRDGLPAKLDTLTQEDIGRSFETAPPR